MVRLEEELLERLRSFEWRKFNVCHVILFGSLARRGEGNDIDLLLVPCSSRGSLDPDTLLDMYSSLSKHLGVDPTLLDLVDASRAGCVLLIEAWRSGLIVYTVSRSKLLDYMLPRLSICEDELISVQRLGIVEAAVEAARRRWSSGGVGKALHSNSRDDSEAGRA